jgi:hypothetical protein
MLAFAALAAPDRKRANFAATSTFVGGNPTALPNFVLKLTS